MLKTWAEQQVPLVEKLYESPEAQSACAQNIRLCGAHTGPLPIARHKDQWLSAHDIEKMALPDRVILADHFSRRTELRQVDNFVPADGVFFTSSNGLPVVFQNRDRVISMYEITSKIPRSLGGAVIESVALAWGITPEDLLASNSLEREENVIVGSASGREIKLRALVLVKPRA